MKEHGLEVPWRTFRTDSQREIAHDAPIARWLTSCQTEAASIMVLALPLTTRPTRIDLALA